jgi:hypothetical protein
MQRCTHPRYHRYEIPCIHTHSSIMTCVSPASFQRFRDIVFQTLDDVGACVSPASNAGGSKVRNHLPDTLLSGLRGQRVKWPINVNNPSNPQ